MAGEIKRLYVPPGLYPTGADVYCRVKIQNPGEADDGYLLDDADGNFANAPADSYITVDEIGSTTEYVLNESRQIWADRKYSVTFFSKVGGSRDHLVDLVRAEGELIIKDDIEVVQTGDSFARIGTDGIGLTAVSLAATGLDSISSTAIGMIEIAKAIWDRILTGGTHNITDSAARRLRNLQEFGDYEHDSVWIDTINGSAGTTDYESGTINNKVKTLVDANTIGVSLNKSGRAIVGGSNIIFAVSQENQNFWGNNWTLALGGRSISGTHIEGADVSGICSGANEPEFHGCCIGNVTIPPTSFIDCDLEGTITLPVGIVYMRHCSGDDTFVIDYGAATSNTTVNASDFSGVITVSNLGASGTDILNVRGHGVLIFDASCVGGTVKWDGHFTVINNGSGITITPDDITTSVIAIQGPTFDTSTDSLEAIRDRGDVAWVTGSGSIASVILAEKVETLLDINKSLNLSITATTRLQYQWLDINGDPVNLNGSTFKFKAVKNAGESSPAIAEITGTISDAPNGRFYFDVLPTTVFKGRYEIWAFDGASVITPLTMAGGVRIETHPRL